MNRESFVGAEIINPKNNRFTFTTNIAVLGG
jgi:hypothetical protein